MIFNHSDTQGIAAAISGAGNLIKTGSGLLTVSNAAAANINTYSGGTVISGGTLATSVQGLGTGHVSIGAAGTLLAQGSGLVANYWDTNGNPSPANFVSIAAFNQSVTTAGSVGLSAQVTSMTPTITDLTNLTNSGNNGGQYFGFKENGGGYGYFPGKYNSNNGAWGGPFESSYVGKITIANPGTYSFGLNSDDGSMMFIDGQAVVVNGSTLKGNSGWQGMDGSDPATQATGSVNLSAGPHDITILYYEGGGGYGLTASWQGPDTSNNRVVLPNSVLSTLTVASLDGAGSIALQGGTDLLAGGDNTNSVFSGAITGSGAFSKMGTGTTTLTGASNFNGSMYVMGGTLQMGDGAHDPTLVANGIGNYSALVYNVAASHAANYVISGSGTLFKTGPGALTLGGANTYSGATTLNAGQLNINTATALGTGSFTITSGTIDNTSGSNVALSTANPQTWNGDFTYAGSANNLNLGTGAVTLGGNRTVTVAANTLTVGGAIGDGGNGYSLTKAGNGTLVLVANNSYTGGTTVSGGSLQLGDGATGNGSGVGNITDNATVVFANNSAWTYGNAISGSGSVVVNGKNGGNWMTLSGNNTYTGGTTVNSGVLQISADTQLGTAPTSPAINITLNGGELFNNNSAPNLAANRNIYLGPNGGYFRNGWGQGITINGHITGPGGLGVVWDGGPMMLAGTCDYAGGTTIGVNGNDYYAGNAQLVLGVDNALPLTGNVSFGTDRAAALHLNGHSAEINGLTGSSNASVDNPAAASTLTVGNGGGNGAFSGVISGNIALVKTGSGTQTLSGNNTYSGGTTINAGLLVVNGYDNAVANGPLALSGGSLDLHGFGPTVTTLNGNGTIGNGQSGGSNQSDLTVTAGGSFSGVIQDGGFGGNSPTGLVLNGGNLTLSGPNTYSDVTTVNGGVLKGGAAGALSPNSAVTINSGALDATGFAQTVKSLTMDASATLNLSVGNILASTNAASLNGTLNISNLGGLSSGTTELMGYLSESGSFSSYTALPSGYNLVYNTSQLDIISAAVAFSGSGTWLGLSASWSNSANWTDGAHPGVPGDGTRPAGADTAAFSGSGTFTAITLDTNPNLAALSFSNSSYTLSGGSLTLNSSTGTATVTALSGTQTFDATVTVNLATSASFAVSNSAQVTIAAAVSGSGALSLTGDGTGTLVLGGANNTYTGGTYVEQGTLIANNNGAIPDSTALVIGAGGTFVYDPTVTGSALDVPHEVHAATAPSTVPEPGTIALLLAALGGAMVWRRVSRRSALRRTTPLEY